MDARWVDLVDPSSEEVLGSLPVHVDPEVVEALAAQPSHGREARPLLESHGSYVFGVLVAARPVTDEDRIAYQELDFVATPSLLVTVQKTAPEGVPFDVSALQPAADHGERVGVLVQRLMDEVAETYLGAIDAFYAEIEELEDAIEDWDPRRVRARIALLRHDLLHTRRVSSALRAATRRVLDDRIEIGEHALFPADVERLFTDTYETLVRVTEELDIARDLLAGVRDHHQSTIVEAQGDVAKKLTVIASLVLVPSLIVGFYGQNFESVFDEDYWSLGTSLALIGGSTILQLALYRWRRWI